MLINTGVSLTHAQMGEKSSVLLANGKTKTIVAGNDILPNEPVTILGELAYGQSQVSYGQPRVLQLSKTRSRNKKEGQQQWCYLFEEFVDDNSTPDYIKPVWMFDYLKRTISTFGNGVGYNSYDEMTEDLASFPIAMLEEQGLNIARGAEPYVESFYLTPFGEATSGGISGAEYYQDFILTSDTWLDGVGTSSQDSGKREIYFQFASSEPVKLLELAKNEIYRAYVSPISLNNFRVTLKIGKVNEPVPWEQEHLYAYKQWNYLVGGDPNAPGAVQSRIERIPMQGYLARTIHERPWARINHYYFSGGNLVNFTAYNYPDEIVPDAKDWQSEWTDTYDDHRGITYKEYLPREFAGVRGSGNRDVADRFRYAGGSISGFRISNPQYPTGLDRLDSRRIGAFDSINGALRTLYSTRFIYTTKIFSPNDPRILTPKPEGYILGALNSTAVPYNVSPELQTGWIDWQTKDFCHIEPRDLLNPSLLPDDNTFASAHIYKSVEDSILAGLYEEQVANSRYKKSKINNFYAPFFNYVETTPNIGNSVYPSTIARYGNVISLSAFVKGETYDEIDTTFPKLNLPNKGFPYLLAIAMG